MHPVSAVHGRAELGAQPGARRRTDTERCKQYSEHGLRIGDIPFALNRASKLRVIGKKLNLVHQLVGYELGQEWMLLLKETCETVEVGERILRPLDFHRSCQDLNPGVPQVFNQRTTSSFEMGWPAASALFQRRSSSEIVSASRAKGSLSTFANSAISCETLRPFSAALAFRVSAVDSSTSTVWILELMRGLPNYPKSSAASATGSGA